MAFKVTDGLKVGQVEVIDKDGFVDYSRIKNSGALSLSGGTLTGSLTLNADPTQNLHAATKQYVDAIKQSLDVKDSVKVATTANITLSGTQTIDGVSVTAGTRVLVKDQTTASENGIYVAASGAWTRATDADSSADVTTGLFVFVESGTQNQNLGFYLTTANPITVGTTGLTFTQFSGAGQITAGAGLTKTGNTIDVVGTANRITVNADNIDIASNYVGQTSINTLGTVSTGTWQATAIGVAYGGTGATTASAALTNLGAAPLASPALTGTPTAPTATTGTNTTQIATTAFVATAVANASSAVVSFNGRSGAITLTGTDVNNALTYTPSMSSGAFPAGGVNSVSAISSGGTRAISNPSTGLGYAGGVRFRFGYYNDADSIAGYSDIIDMSTFTDNTGGGFNSLYFNKSSQKIAHKFSVADGTTWTTKQLAYTTDNISQFNNDAIYIKSAAQANLDMGSNYLYASSGTVALPGLAFSGDTDTGIWRPTANTLAVSVGGGEKIRFDATGAMITGKLSLGTASLNSNVYLWNIGSFTGAGSRYGQINDVTIDATQALTADCSYTATYSILKHDSTDANKGSFASSPHGTHSQVTLASVAGGASGSTLAVGARNYVLNQAGSGSAPDIRGTYSIVSHNSTVGNASSYGAYNHLYLGAQFTGTVSNAYGTYNRLERVAGTLAVAYGVYNSFLGTTNRKIGLFNSGSTDLDLAVSNTSNINIGHYNAGTDTVTSRLTINTAGDATFGGKIYGSYLLLDRYSLRNSGIAWYTGNSGVNSSWVDYMTNPTTSTGPNGNLTAPSGSIVTSWALRRYIENAAGYGWTFESGSAVSTTPNIVAEIRASDGASKWGGDMQVMGQVRATGWYGGTTGSYNGLAAEIGVSGGNAYIHSYNRGTSSYGAIRVTGSSVNLEPQGGSATVNGNNIYHAGSNSTLMVDRGIIADTAMDTAISNGFYQVTSSGYNDTMLTFNAAGSTGPVQMRFYYGGNFHWRNKTDSATWTAWRTLWHNGNLTNPASMNNNNSGYFGATRIFSGYDSGVDGSIGCNAWFRTSGDNGLYFASYATGIAPATTGSFGSFRCYGNTNGYVGMQFGSGGIGLAVMATTAQTSWGFHSTSQGVWHQYCDTSTYDMHFKGNVIAYSSTISDRRLKKDIEPIRSALDKLLKITGVTYSLIENDKRSIGVIAQDVQNVFPEAVSEVTTPLAPDGSSGGESLLTVQYGNLVGPIIEALREIDARLTALENK